MTFLTLMKINGDYENCLEYVTYIRNLYSTKEMQEKLHLLDTKIELYVADIYLNMVKSMRPNVVK